MRPVVAVMQPYFAPYLGYYRLLAEADVFVLFDCVQFPRRGWVHRNRLLDASGEARWLTLPLKPAPYDARIDAIEFATDADAAMAERSAPFAALRGDAAALLACAPFRGLMVEYLERQILAACDLFGLRPTLLRSSTLNIAPEIRGQERVLAICEALNAREYINAPGGVDYYDQAAFDARGIGLRFLPPYDGPPWSVLERLGRESTRDLANELRVLQPA
jgi:hypothetical protein